MANRGWEQVSEADLASAFGRRLVREAPTRVVPATERPVKTSRRFDWADTLKQQIALCGLPEPQRDYRFDPVRRWLMDLAWPALMVSCEVDGGEWTVGKHSRGLGMQANCEKLNAALLAGWKPYRFTGSQVERGYALTTMERALTAERPRSDQ